MRNTIPAADRPISGTLDILVVEDDPVFAALLSGMVEVCPGGPTIRSARRLADAIAMAEERPPHLVLLDLSLPDSTETETMERIASFPQESAVIVITGRAESEYGLRSVAAGAQDYILKGPIDREILWRSISYSIERHRLKREIAALSLRDELTGLYNRRGFFSVAEKQLSMARRTGRRLFAVYMDIDSFKEINDAFGHDAGDRALREFASLLTRTFRESDIIGRVGGDEFVVLVTNAGRGERVEKIVSRLGTALSKVNAAPGRAYAIHASTGTAIFEPDSNASLEGLLAEADHRMYSSKKGND